MADEKIFQVELPQLPPASAFDAYGDAQTAITLQAVADLARSNWLSLAMDRMQRRRQDRDDYIRSISQPDILPGMAVLTLTGKRAHDLEFGRPSYDLRDVLLGPHVRIKKRGESGKGAYRNKKGGLYRPIPFSHQGPDGHGATGTPLGQAYTASMGSERAHELGKWVYKAAKMANVTLEKPDRKVAWGERLPAGLAPRLKSHHVTDIYAGLYRIAKDYKNEKTGKVTRQFTMRTFRTISTTKRTGWIVPSTSGLHLMAQLQAKLAQDLPEFLSQAQGGR